MFTVVEPNTCNPLSKQDARYTPTVATETRNKLKSIFPLDTAFKPEEVQPLSKEEIKAIKERTLEQLGSFDKSEVLVEQHLLSDAGIPAEDWENLSLYLAVLGRASSVPFNTPRYMVRDNTAAREYSYVLQTCTNWIRTTLHTQGIKRPEDKGLVQACLQYPTGTSSQMDSLCRQYGQHYGFMSNRNHSFEAVHVRVPSGEKYYREQHFYEYAQGMLFGIVYTEAGSTYFAGFITEDDLLNLRFTRTTLGAAVMKLTQDDELARKLSGKFRQCTAYEFVLHPNDVPWGEVYLSTEEGSCMTHPTSSYSCPHGIHPVDTYSSAYYGCGDNGLVLVQAMSGGTAVGRGIMNVRTKKIVRWYGPYNAEVQLKNMFGVTGDSGALEDSWLALVGDADCFAGPYVDGGYGYGDIQGNRVVLTNDSDYTQLEDTSGVYGGDEQYMCTLTGGWYSENNLEYQSYNETWFNRIYTTYDYARQCPITGEWFNNSDGHWCTIDGDDVRVSEYGHHNASDFGYEDLGGSIGHTRNLDDYILLADGEYTGSDNAVYDDVTEDYYTQDQYEALVEAREAEDEQDAA